MIKAVKGAFWVLGLAAVAAAVASPREASALHIQTKFEVPGYSPGDTAYLCSDGSPFYSQAIGYNNNGASICFQQAHQTGSWVPDTGWCTGTTTVKGLLRAGLVKSGPVFCSTANVGWDTVVSCNANMNIRRNSPAASCAFKTPTGSAYLGN
jgi:hypothetical protein